MQKKKMFIIINDSQCLKKITKEFFPHENFLKTLKKPSLKYLERTTNFCIIRWVSKEKLRGDYVVFSGLINQVDGGESSENTFSVSQYFAVSFSKCLSSKVE